MSDWQDRASRFARALEAADRIAELEADNKRLRKALLQSRCPQPLVRSVPKKVGRCWGAGECGCEVGEALEGKGDE